MLPRDPEHTGENRCRPCTVVNAALLALGCVAVALWLPAKRRVRALAAVGLAVAGGVTIALRGYLVPATPRFAPRLVRAVLVVRDRFDHGGPAAGDSARTAGGGTGAAGGGPDDPGNTGTLADEADAETGERVADALLDAGVLHAVGDALHLDEGFRARWREEMAVVHEGDLGGAIRDVAPRAGPVEIVDDGRWVVLASGDPAAERWVPRPVATAEVATVRVLAEAGISLDLRVPAASALRTFLRRCPVCDVPLTETTTDDCCGTGANPVAPPERVLACPECEQKSTSLDRPF
ncbi:hypothetical protein [Halomicrococcus gelatinilyticus]|uniref:hypothetical protein n=1 Tax=Halomicrococcus gelatinilyticus TaxID=1702103 RepID=UPI002E11DB21